MEAKKRAAWNLKGRSAAAALDPSTRHRITQSHAMAPCLRRPLMATVEALITVPFVGGLTGPLKRPERFICLVTRLLQITPDPSVVLAMLRQDVHKYLRVAALFVIRLIGNDAMMREALRIGWADYRKIRVYGYAEDRTGAEAVDATRAEDGEVVRAPSCGIMCVDEITDRLFNVRRGKKGVDAENGDEWLGLRFAPLFL